MKLKNLVCTALIVQLAIPMPSVRAQSVPTPTVAETPLLATRMYRQVLEAHPGNFPFKLDAAEAINLQGDIQATAHELLGKLNDSTYSLDGLREEILANLL